LAGKPQGLECLTQLARIVRQREYGHTTGPGRALADCRAAVAAAPTAPAGWASRHRVRPGGADRDHLRAQDGDPVGIPAPRDGLWQWHDLLAAVAGLAGRGRVAAAARGVARSAGASGQNRLDAGE